jgi:hypothetical protein
MRKIVVFLCFGLLICSCNSNPIEKPENLLTKNQMVDILYDLYVLNAISTSDYMYFRDRNIIPSRYIYKKYNIDSLQFATSDKYYASDLEEYEKIYERVTERLQSNKVEVDSLLKISPESEIEVVSPKPKRPIKVDSLQKKRRNGKSLLNDTVKN